MWTRLWVGHKSRGMQRRKRMAADTKRKERQPRSALPSHITHPLGLGLGKKKNAKRNANAHTLGLRSNTTQKQYCLLMLT